MAADPNPFTLVHDALWTLAERHPLIAAVPARNRIKYNDPVDRDPTKDKVAVADLPELVLVCEGLSGNTHETSSSSRVNRQFAFFLSTGDFRANELLLQYEWALWCALHDWKSVLGGLQWLGRSFVKRADITSVSNGASDSERNRGIKGWSAAWRCEVEMHFKTSDLLDELTAPSSSGP